MGSALSDIDALTAQLAQIFHDQLNLEVSDADQDLIDEGLLDSLSLVEMLLVLESEFGVEVSILDIDFDAFRSVREIAKYLAPRMAATAAPAAATAAAPVQEDLEPA